MDREFRTIGPYKWEITDEYGWPISKSKARNIRLDHILSDYDDDVDLRFVIGLHKKDEDGWGQYNAIFNPKTKLLKISGGEDNGIRVNLPCDKIEDTVTFIDLICRGNNMEVAPVYLAGFKF